MRDRYHPDRSVSLTDRRQMPVASRPDTTMRRVPPLTSPKTTHDLTSLKTNIRNSEFEETPVHENHRQL